MLPKATDPSLHDVWRSGTDLPRYRFGSGTTGTGSATHVPRRYLIIALGTRQLAKLVALASSTCKHDIILSMPSLNLVPRALTSGCTSEKSTSLKILRLFLRRGCRAFHRSVPYPQARVRSTRLCIPATVRSTKKSG